MDENFSPSKIINAEMSFEPRRSSRSSRSKINYHQLVNKPRSKSCSNLKPSQEQVIDEDSEIDNGNELVQMMKTKFTLTSPKLKLATIPSVELEMTTSPFSPTKVSDCSTFSILADPTLNSANQPDTPPLTTSTDELKTFMRDAMRKQHIHFENQLQQQQQTQQKQLQQLKYQIQQNIQQQILQLNSEKPTLQIQEEPISMPTKVNKKYEPKQMQRNQQHTKKPIMKSETLKQHTATSKHANSAAGTASSATKPLSKALTKPTLFPPST